MRTKFQRASHTRWSMNKRKYFFSQIRHHKMTRFFGQSKKQCRSTVLDSIDPSIDVLHTRTLAEDELEDTCEHASSNNFNCHNFDHYSTSAFAITSKTFIQYCLEFLKLVLSICTILPRCHHVGFSSWTIKIRFTVDRIPIFCQFEN